MRGEERGEREERREEEDLSGERWNEKRLTTEPFLREKCVCVAKQAHHVPEKEGRETRERERERERRGLVPELLLLQGNWNNSAGTGRQRWDKFPTSLTCAR